MTIAAEVQKLDQDALIEMFELDLEAITGVASDHFYFHAGTNNASQPILWQGKTYQPMPVKADGFEVTAKGTLPRPRLEASNVTGVMAALAIAYEDLIGARVIRRRTYAKFLDGEPAADPNQHFPDDVFFVERKVSGNKHSYVWELASSLDLEGFQLPARSITVNLCTWDYRGPECGYTGLVYFDASDNLVSTVEQDVCSKSINACKKRFGDDLLPFGGFPAAKAYKF